MPVALAEALGQIGRARQTFGANHERRDDMRWPYAGAIVLSITLPGCTSLPLKDITNIEKLISTTSGTCKVAKPSLVQGAVSSFVFILPVAASDSTAETKTPGVAHQALDVNAPDQVRHAASFADFESLSSAAKALLPAELQKDTATDTIIRLMLKTAALSQLATAHALNVTVDSSVDTAVASYKVPDTITRGQLKDFASAIVKAQLRPSLGGPVKSDASSPHKNAFATYFTNYYEGKFVDRLGQSIKKPQIASTTLSIPISITIPDADIASALTVLIEYVADLFDTTPVLIDTPTVIAATKFYPGGTTSEPTALVANLARPHQLSSSCGVTADTAPILADVANAAADEAATVGGLVAQSFGGVGVSLGVFGKISLGDNQTVGTIVKTAASRVALRSSFAAAYWTLERIAGSSDVHPTRAEASGANGYLIF